ncbi:hypothetical protein Scep_010973 [Stephania cephalantha]|uniref:Uncharacterized protein n=1 Tax=Stephania cephalantha TaxID=152367 RepID=A0AAP0PER7_9MAGN
MAKLQCANSNGYSSPVPIIGLYIVIASLACLLLMLWDILFAIRRKNRHIPCRRFSLNSLTISLLAIVAKLPVDLTTNMPSARDQLSKLSGTAMSCVCIGFMAPSIASSKESENVANMASLSIFVVTVAVNICIQLGTGVIFSFVAEHIIIICCMFMLLAILWFNTLGFNVEKAALHESNVAHFLTIPKSESSFVHRAKSWYISSCVNNPQLLLCRAPFSSAIGPICMMCSLVLLQASYRSIVVRSLRFCEGISDYRWSIWIIAITQILTTAFGALTIAFRWLAVVCHLNTDHLFGIVVELQDLRLQFSFIKRSLKTSTMVLSKFIFKSWLFFLLLLIHAPIFVAAIIVMYISDRRESLGRSADRARENTAVSLLGLWREDFDFETLDRLSQRAIMICVNNMNKYWMNVERDQTPPYHHMVQLLSRCHHSTVPRQRLNRFLHFGNNEQTRNKVTCFSMVLLVKLVAASVPSNLTKSMTDALGEAFEIVYYVDKKMNVESADSRNRHLAKLLLQGGDIDLMSNKSLLENADDDPLRSAISKFRSAYRILPAGPTILESIRVSNFVRDREYATIQELYDYVEQLFSEMLQHFLAQLPNCVFKQVNDGSVEDCEERARFIAKHLCQLHSSLEDKVQWKFPVGFPNTPHFFDSPQDHVTATSQNVLP